MSDHVLSWMKENDVPLTKENYLAIAYLGEIHSWTPRPEPRFQKN